MDCDLLTRVDGSGGMYRQGIDGHIPLGKRVWRACLRTGGWSRAVVDEAEQIPQEGSDRRAAATWSMQAATGSMQAAAAQLAKGASAASKRG